MRTVLVLCTIIDRIFTMKLYIFAAENENICANCRLKLNIRLKFRMLGEQNCQTEEILPPDPVN